MPMSGLLGRAMIALIIGSCVPTYCAAGPIIWFKLTLPPGVIVTGPEQGRGYTDQLIVAVLHNLPQYTVTMTSFPLARELQMMKEGGPYCASDLLKTPERENFLRFTAPFGYVLPLGLVVRVEDKDIYDRLVDEHHMINLERLMRTPGVLGVVAHRTYGKMPDSVISEVLTSNPGKIMQVYEDNGTATLFKMLSAHHINALLAFPMEQVYLSVQSAHADRYYAYPIVESQELLPMRFSCVNQAATDDIFASLDAQAKSAALQHTFQRAYEQWLPPYLVPTYRARLKETRVADN